MKTSFGKLVVALWAAVVLASFVMAPVAEAQRAGGGGGGARQGGAQAGGGGGGARQGGAQAGGGGSGARQGGAQAGGGGSGARQSAQVNNSRADVRSSDVRNSSVNNVNNVNVNANRNVNVQGNSGCCNNNGWDNPLAAAAVVGGTIAAVGSIVARPPSNCVPVNYSGMVYQQCGATWYAPQGSQYVVVSPPY